MASRRQSPIKIEVVGATSLVGALILLLMAWLEPYSPVPLTPLVEEVLSMATPSPSPLVVPPPVWGIDGASASAVLVTRVIDGDTIVLATGEKVRYIGIDAPEVRGNECGQQAATQRNQELVLNQYVTLVQDVNNQDRYGRLLRYVYVGDTFINQQLVAEGFALAASYPPDIKYQQLFQTAQKEAQAHNRGLWGSCPQP